MSSVIELYKTGLEEAPLEIPLREVMQAGIQSVYNRNLDGCRMMFFLSMAPTRPRLPGTPSMYNLLSDYGYGTVVVERAGVTVYRHPHSVEEIIAMPLREALRHEFPEVKEWSYRLVGPGLPRSAVRKAPLTEGAFEAPLLDDADAPDLEIERAPEPQPPFVSLRDFGAPRVLGDNPTGLTVVVNAHVDSQLRSAMHFANDVEEGGFLTGRVYRDADREDDYLVYVVGVPRAEHTGASFLHFNFTGDSFRDIKLSLTRARSGVRLVGWYHTHLFAATNDFGLSTIDVDLHLSTFSQPWQVAGLVNIDKGERTLRFYARVKNTLLQCPVRVANRKPEVA